MMPQPERENRYARTPALPRMLMARPAAEDACLLRGQLPSERGRSRRSRHGNAEAKLPRIRPNTCLTDNVDGKARRRGAHADCGASSEASVVGVGSLC